MTNVADQPDPTYPLWAKRTSYSPTDMRGFLRAHRSIVVAGYGKSGMNLLLEEICRESLYEHPSERGIAIDFVRTPQELAESIGRAKDTGISTQRVADSTLLHDLGFETTDGLDTLIIVRPDELVTIEEWKKIFQSYGENISYESPRDQEARPRPLPKDYKNINVIFAVELVPEIQASQGYFSTVFSNFQGYLGNEQAGFIDNGSIEDVVNQVLDPYEDEPLPDPHGRDLPPWLFDVTHFEKNRILGPFTMYLGMRPAVSLGVRDRLFAATNGGKADEVIAVLGIVRQLVVDEFPRLEMGRNGEFDFDEFLQAPLLRGMVYTDTPDLLEELEAAGINGKKFSIGQYLGADIQSATKSIGRRSGGSTENIFEPLLLEAIETHMNNMGRGVQASDASLGREVPPPTQ